MNRFSAETPSICNEILDSLFSEPKKILIYGEAASGKTNLILNLLKCSLANGFIGKKTAVYISTEGSEYQYRAIQLNLYSPNILFAEAIDQDHLLELILKLYVDIDLMNLGLLVIDSINNFYRVEAESIDGLKKFIALLAILSSLNREYNVYILTSAQIRVGEEGLEEPSGMKYLFPWADIVMKTVIGENTRILIVEKPLSFALRFHIGEDGISWIS